MLDTRDRGPGPVKVLSERAPTPGLLGGDPLPKREIRDSHRGVVKEDASAARCALRSTKSCCPLIAETLGSGSIAIRAVTIRQPGGSVAGERVGEAQVALFHSSQSCVHRRGWCCHRRFVVEGPRTTLASPRSRTRIGEAGQLLGNGGDQAESGIPWRRPCPYFDSHSRVLSQDRF